VRDRTRLLVSQELQSFGAAIERFEPDGLVASLGTRVASESDPERAVLAGMAVLARVALVDRLLARRQLSMRAGVGVDAARAAVGPEWSPDTGAFELLRHGVAGIADGLWVTTTVRPLVEEKFLLGETEGGQVALTQVTGLAPAPASEGDRTVDDRARARTPRIGPPDGRGRPGRTSDLVGRADELAVLDLAWDEHVRAGVAGGATATATSTATTGALVGVRGEAGIGKSRLIDEFVRTRAERGAEAPVVARCASIARSPLRGGVALAQAVLGIPDRAPVDLARDRVARGLGELQRPDLFPAVGHLLGLPDAGGGSGPVRPQAVRDRLVHAVGELAGAAARRAVARTGLPLILVLEDAHAIDDLSRQAIEALLASTRTSLFALVAYRPPWEVPERWKRARACRALEVGPLSAMHARKLARELLRDAAPAAGGAWTDEALDRIVDLSGGNPLFLEELVTHGPAGAAGAADSTASGLLRALVVSRVDTLAPRERALLELCSCLGTEVDGAVLEEMAGAFWGAEPADLPLLLDRLVAGRFLDAREASGRRSYSFRPALARDVVHSTLLDSNRHVLHLLALRALERVEAADTDAVALALAEHARQAGHHEKRLHYMMRALAAAAARHEHDAVLTLAREVQDLLAMEADAAPESPPRPGWHRESERERERLRRMRTFDALAACEVVHEVRGNHDDQRRDLQRMMELARDLGDDARLARALDRLSRFYWWREGDHRSAEELATRALAIQERHGDLRGQALALRNLACAASVRGDHRDAIERHRRAYDLFLASGDPPGMSASLCSMALNMGEAGLIKQGIALVRQALSLDRRQQDRRGVARELRTLGDLYRSVGADDRALGCYEKALASDLEIGYRQGEAHTLACAGAALLNRGRTDEAIDRLRAALAIGVEIDSHTLAAEVGVLLAEGCCLASAADAALRHAGQARDDARRMGIPRLEILASSWLGQAHLLAGSTDRALRSSGSAVKLLGDRSAVAFRPQVVWYNHARVLAAADRAADAAAARQCARDLVNARAQALEDPRLATSYLRQIRIHRAILEERGGAPRGA
jgi:adenylate cyclase